MRVVDDASWLGLRSVSCSLLSHDPFFLLPYCRAPPRLAMAFVSPPVGQLLASIARCILYSCSFHWLGGFHTIISSLAHENGVCGVQKTTMMGPIGLR